MMIINHQLIKLKYDQIGLLCPEHFFPASIAPNSVLFLKRGLSVKTKYFPRKTVYFQTNVLCKCNFKLFLFLKTVTQKNANFIHS